MLSKKFLILYFIFTVSFVGKIFANNEIQVGSFPIFTLMDYKEVEVSMFLRCQYKEYDQLFSEWKLKAQLTKQEKIFKHFIMALQKEDLLALKSLSYVKNRSSDKSFFNTIKMHRKIFVRIFNVLKVYKQFYFGRDSVFLWGVDKFEVTNKPLRAFFRFININNFFLWDTDKSDSLTILIMNTLQRMAENSDIRVISSKNFNYECPIPKTTKGSVVYLQFNGKPYDQNIFDEGEDIEIHDSVDEVLSFYKKAYQTFKKGTSKEFADFYTKESRKKYLRWTSKMTPDVYDSYYKNVLFEGRRVRFVLDADPMYLVFYEINVKGDDEKYFNYEYVVKDPVDGKLKLTNFYFYGFFDNFLNEKRFFVNTILKDILGKNKP